MDTSALARLEELDGQIMRALADDAADLPDERMAERTRLLEQLFGGTVAPSQEAQLRQAIERHEKIQTLASQRRDEVGRAMSNLHFSHRAVNAYMDNQ